MFYQLDLIILKILGIQSIDFFYFVELALLRFLVFELSKLLCAYIL